MFSGSTSKNGGIEVICGCMFSGKTEELIKRIKRAEIEGYKTVLFKPEIDDRYHKQNIVSHDSNSVESIAVGHSGEILNHINNYNVIGIDEGQFFDEGIVKIIKYLAANKYRVIIAGLDMDFMGRPFGPMPAIMAIADNVTELNAICQICGNNATLTYRKTSSDLIIEIGETNIYEARCLTCFLNPQGFV